MAKDCRDCSNGQCEDQRYVVYFTTKSGFRQNSTQCFVDEKYWFAEVTGRIGGLSLQFVPITVSTSPFKEEIIECLVLEVNGQFLIILATVNQFDPITEDFKGTRDTSKPQNISYLGDCDEKSFFIDNIILVDIAGNLLNNTRCKCTNGDEEITCDQVEGGICCIPKSILNALCERV